MLPSHAITDAIHFTHFLQKFAHSKRQNFVGSQHFLYYTNIIKLIFSLIIFSNYQTIMSYQTVGVSGLSSFNKIPEYAKEYKREYLFIIGINKEFKYLRDRDYDEYGADRVRNLLERFLKEQEKGKLKEINELFFWKNDILDIIEFYYEVSPNFYFQQYNLDLEFILIFDKFYDKINFKYYDWGGNIKVKECDM